MWPLVGRTNLDLRLLDSGEGDLLMTILLVSPAMALAVLSRGDFDLRGGDRLDFRVDEEAVGGVGRLGDRLVRRLEGDGDLWR